MVTLNRAIVVAGPDAGVDFSKKDVSELVSRCGPQTAWKSF